MHGVKRARVPPTTSATSAADEAKRREKEQARIDEYKSLLARLLEQRDNKEYTNEALELSAQVLALNPEFQTGWGIRRRILLDGIFPTSDSTEQQRLLERDVQLTNRALRQNPKNYSVWEHRKWCLQTLGERADWRTEMGMVDAYLEKDGRNFHSWDYRRYLLAEMAKLPPSDSRPNPDTRSELAYTNRKISENFSNFSAWHYRTKLLQRLWDENGWDEEDKARRTIVDAEFDLVKQAIWSDPNDQSAWLYHRWLVGKGSEPIVRREIQGIEELLEEEPDSRWCLESLVYYKRLLVTILVDQGEDTRDEREVINETCLDMLDQLQRVDPTRKARYQDLAVHIVPRQR